MAILADFKARFPAISSEQAELYIPILEPIYRTYYDCEYTADSKEIILNLLAHLLINETSSGVVQQKSSVSVGNVSTSFVTSSNTGDRAVFFNTSKYGQRFWLLMQNSAIQVDFV